MLRSRAAYSLEESKAKEYTGLFCDRKYFCKQTKPLVKYLYECYTSVIRNFLYFLTVFGLFKHQWYSKSPVTSELLTHHVLSHHILLHNLYIKNDVQAKVEEMVYIKCFCSFHLHLAVDTMFYMYLLGKR